MNTARKIVAGVGALSALTASVAHAQTSAQASANGSVNIQQGIAVAKSADLGFGTILRPASGSTTVAVSTTGVRSFGNPAIVAGVGSAGVSAAAFDIVGQGGLTYSISTPGSFTMSSGANDLTVTTSASSTGGTLSGTASSTGSASFSVGGSFPISDATPTGAYTGSFTVTVQYN